MKEKIKFIISLFTRILSGIIIIDTIILCLRTGKNTQLSLIDIFGIILIAFLCSVLYLPFLTDKVFSKRKMFIMNVLYYIGINIISLSIGFWLKWFYFTKLSSFLPFEIVITGTYVLVMFIFYKIDIDTADKMNQKLKEFEI